MPDNSSSQPEEPADQKPIQPEENQPEQNTAKKKSRPNRRKRASKSDKDSAQSEGAKEGPVAGKDAVDDRKTTDSGKQAPKKNVRGSRAIKPDSSESEQRINESGSGNRSDGKKEDTGEPSDEITNQNRESTRGRQNRNRPPEQQKAKLDPEKVSKKAWSIFLAEVSEEGVALITDNDARELSRRCFRLAELFLQEEQRRD